jgi:hypothetical protein
LYTLFLSMFFVSFTIFINVFVSLTFFIFCAWVQLTNFC